MHRLLSGAALSAILVAGNVAPAFANTNTSSEVTPNEVPANEVALDPNLVEIEGRTLTDAEAVGVEGQVLRIRIPRPRLINPWLRIIRIR